MQAIADALGISKVTVFKALRQQPGVSDEMRQQIFQAADAMGYHYTDIQRSYQIAFLVAQRFFLESDAFYTNIYYIMYQYCLDQNHQLPLFVISQEEEQAGILPHQLTSGHFSGIVVAGEMNKEYLKKIQTLQLPTIYTDFYDAAFSSDCVLVDNYYMTYRVTDYLIGKGHRQIGFVGSPESGYTSICDRYFGYCKALKIHHIPYRHEWVISNSAPDLSHYFFDIPLPDPLPTAFVCHCDMAAYYLIEALNRKGLRCPEDVSIVSFDNTRLATTMTPQLTTVDISTRDLALKSIERLLYRITAPDSPKERLYITTNLVKRDSVAPPSR